MFVTMVGAALLTPAQPRRAADRPGPAHPRRRPGQHPRARRRRRRHHHPRGVRLLAAREGLGHPALHARHAHRQLRRLPRHRHLRAGHPRRRRRAALLHQRRDRERRPGPRRPRRRAAGPLRRVGRQALPPRLLGRGDVVAGRRLERRQPDVRRLHDPRDQRRGGRRPRRRQVVPRLHPVAHLPADGDDVPRQAGVADPRLRRARRVLHAVPRGHAAVAAEHRPDTRGVAQQAALQRADGPVALAFIALCVNEVRKAVDGA